jgi:hypothetical protein
MKLINITFMIREKTDELGENPASVHHEYDLTSPGIEPESPC